MSKDPYSKDDSLSSPWMKWGKKGDKIWGTLISKSEKEQVNDAGKTVVEKVYEIKADGGEYHVLDENKVPKEPAVVIDSGEIFNVGGHFTIDPVLKNIKLGQKLKIEFTETKPSQKKGNAPMKVRQVFSKGEMDEEWLKENSEKVAGEAQPW
jgi:hypothetical protein